MSSKPQGELASWVSAGAFVFAFLALFAVRWWDETIGYFVWVPVYLWILFGKGASVVAGSWPADMFVDADDENSPRKIRIGCAIFLVLDTAAWLFNRYQEAGAS